MATQLNDWLSIDKISGTGNAEITLTASSYQELVDRTATLKVQGIGTNAILTVRQKAFILSNDYFWIEFEETDGTVNIENSNVSYSFDGDTWVNGAKSISMGKNKLVYLKDLKTSLKPIYDNIRIKFTKRAKVGGNISSLRGMEAYGFRYYFENNTYLTNASALILPWTTLANGCYEGMFSGCSSLKNAPKLPATTLANSCYNAMFQGCTSLVVAPALPATTLADSCYNNMFGGCSSLVFAPTLPATTLANNCYREMFYMCDSLSTAPELPVTTLAEGCYSGMFAVCRGLVNAPKILPATTLEKGCYGSMFLTCTSLKKAPELPATTLVEGCYRGMFMGCTSLNYIKMLAIQYRYDSLQEWTKNVASSGTFIKHPDATNPTMGDAGIPQGWIINDAELPITPNPDKPNPDKPNPDKPNPDTPNPDTPSNDYFWVKFEETNGKVSITDAKVSYSFDGNTWTNNVANISMRDNTIVYLQGLNNTTNNKAKIQFTKKAKVGGDLSSLKEIGDSAFKYLFLNNTYLTDASALILPWTTLANGCYYSMFKGCTSLVAAPTLPATTLAKDCYYNMFYGCIRLVSAPTLPATTLAVYCYGRMFAGCTNLNYIKMLATDISADSCLASWVDGVASTGTFIKHPDANLSSGVSGIPSNWTVENATE